MVWAYSLEDGVVGVDTFDAIGVGNGGNGERVLQEARSMLTSGFLFLDTAFDLSENKNVFYNYIGIIRHLIYLNIY